MIRIADLIAWFISVTCGSSGISFRTLPGPPIDGLELLLSSTDDSAILADTLPFDFDLTAFDRATLSFVSTSGSDLAFVFGDIDTMFHNPEPGTAVLLGLGLVAIGLRRRGRRLTRL